MLKLAIFSSKYIKKHKLYIRSVADLVLEREITLKQALLGINFNLKYLDGKDFTISSIPGVSPTWNYERQGSPILQKPHEPWKPDHQVQYQVPSQVGSN
jgi:DnaJ-class molecular chaperone